MPYFEVSGRISYKYRKRMILLYFSSLHMNDLEMGLVYMIKEMCVVKTGRPFRTYFVEMHSLHRT